MKERIDVSLDNRHVVSLLIAGIVVFGAVFILGVVVGKKLSGSERAAHAPDLLSALDQKAAAGEPKDSAFTFQEELTKKTPPSADSSKSKPVAETVVPVAKKAAQPESLPPIRGEEAAPKDVKSVESEQAAAKPPPPPEPASGPPAVAPRPTAGPPPTAAPPATAASAPPPKEGTRALPRAEPKPVAARTGAKDRSLREVMSRMERDPSPGATPNRYTIQLSSTQMRSDADRFVAKLRDKGYAPFVLQAQVPGRGKWYRVRLGNFPSKEAASRYLADFRRETRLDAIVTPQ